VLVLVAAVGRHWHTSASAVLLHKAHLQVLWHELLLLLLLLRVLAVVRGVWWQHYATTDRAVAGVMHAAAAVVVHATVVDATIVQAHSSRVQPLGDEHLSLGDSLRSASDAHTTVAGTRHKLLLQ
jgi:hypothetical protein